MGRSQHFLSVRREEKGKTYRRIESVEVESAAGCSAGIRPARAGVQRINRTVPPRPTPYTGAQGRTRMGGGLWGRGRRTLGSINGLSMYSEDEETV